MTHLHITSWVLALILFGLAYNFYRKGKGKPAKITHMILRLDYLLILYSGGDLLGDYFSADGLLMVGGIVKGLAGLWAIVALEMILVKLGKGKPVAGFLIQLAVAVIIALVLGFGWLPLGLLP